MNSFHLFIDILNFKFFHFFYFINANSQSININKTENSGDSSVNNHLIAVLKKLESKLDKFDKLDLLNLLKDLNLSNDFDLDSIAEQYLNYTG